MISYNIYHDLRSALTLMKLQHASTHLKIKIVLKKINPRVLNFILFGSWLKSINGSHFLGRKNITTN